MTNGSKLGVWLGAAIAAAGVGYVALRPSSDKPAVKYETTKADTGTIVAKVTATGTLSSLVTVQVGSQVSGRLAQIFVDFNSVVKKGQVIAKIDPQLFQAALEQAKANALAARANVRRAEVQAAEAARQYTRTKSLAEQKLIAQADLDTALANKEAADANVEAMNAAVAQTAAQLDQAKVNLAYTTIVSPIDGVIISRNVDVGQTVAASLQAPTLFVIAEDLRKMQVNTSVAEADIGKLQSGMKATFVVDAYPGKRFEGLVRQIRNAPQTVQNVVTYDAVIDVENPNLELRPGMTANVTFVHARVEDVLRVPNAALRFRPASASGRAGAGTRTSTIARGRRGDELPNRRTIWVLRAGVPEAVPVTTGVTDGSFTAVESPKLSAGDEVIVASTGEGSGPPSGMGGMGGRPGGGMRMF